MKADVCNDRFDFSHTQHCDVYRAHTDDADDPARPHNH